MALIPHQPTDMGMVTPLVTPEQAAQAIAQYEALKTAIIRPEEDIHMYQGRPFLKKRFWRRISTCFGLSLEMVNEAREHDADGRLAYSVMYRAIAPNGRFMIGDGYCSRSERGHEQWPEHTVRATAHTRAKNRAISDLVGGGEVSAEEMPEDEDETPRRRTSNGNNHAPQASPQEWETEHQRALKLGITEEQWQVARRASITEVRKRLDAREQENTVEGTVVEPEPAPSTPTPPAPISSLRLEEDVRKAILSNTTMRQRLRALGYTTKDSVEEFLRWCAGEGAITEMDVRAMIAGVEEQQEQGHSLQGLPGGGQH